MKTSRVSWCFKRIILSMQIQMDNIVFVRWGGMAVARHAFHSGLKFKFRLSKRCFFRFISGSFFSIISSELLGLCKARVQEWMSTSLSLVAWKTHHLSTSIKNGLLTSYWLSTNESDSLAKTRSMQSMHDWHCVSVRMLAVFWLAAMLSSVSVYFDIP